VLPLEYKTVSLGLEIEPRKIDLLWVALSIGLAILTWVYAVREDYAPIWLYILLDLQCAIVFAIRYPARRSTKRPLEIFVTLLSLNYYFAFQPEPIGSPELAAAGGIISAIGASLAILSIYCLGRSFAILPALRHIQTSGMYRVVRHPIYLSYMVMALGTVLRHLTIYNAAVAIIGIALMIWRINFEERLLEENQTYRDYAKAVPYRLIPGVY
jgi:protein-S-isoprenylcysteine O-methyltransferase Ste14